MMGQQVQPSVGGVGDDVHRTEVRQRLLSHARQRPATVAEMQTIWPQHAGIRKRFVLHARRKVTFSLCAAQDLNRHKEQQ